MGKLHLRERPPNGNLSTVIFMLKTSTTNATAASAGGTDDTAGGC